MPAKPPRIPDDLQQWITARKRHGLSHVHVQMTRELGMNARKLGKWLRGGRTARGFQTPESRAASLPARDVRWSGYRGLAAFAGRE